MFHEVNILERNLIFGESIELRLQLMNSLIAKRNKTYRLQIISKIVTIIWRRSENFFRRTTYILFPDSKLVSCVTLKLFATR
jgi:hypothetical protein